MSKQSFILYARNHPEFASHVLNGKVSWQQLYELYEIYGEDSNIWNNYTKNDYDLNSFKEVFKVIKNVDLDSLKLLYYPDVKKLGFRYKIVLFADRILNRNIREEREMAERIRSAAEPGDINRLKMFLDKTILRLESNMN